MARAPATAPTPWAVTRIDVPRSPASNSLTATAGMRAMNGDSSRAATAMARMAVRQPGSAHAPRAPVTIRRPSPPVSSGSGRGGGSRTRAMATRTAPNDRALTTKANVYEPPTSTTPARAGPTTRPRLYWADESEMAPSSSSRGTRSGRMAW